ASGYNGSAAQGQIERSIARCFSNPKSFVAAQPPILIPGLVSLKLSDAERVLGLVGLDVGAVHGPTGLNSIVTEQEPKGGSAVPVGSSVDLTTKAQPTTTSTTSGVLNR